MKPWAGLTLALTPFLLHLPLPWMVLISWAGFLVLWFYRDQIKQPVWFLLPLFLTALWRLPSPPLLADDYLRYLFDGALISQGILPYGKLPLDFPGLGGLDIPRPEVATVYPPLAELVFALGYQLGDSVLSFRLLNIVALLGFCALCPWAFPKMGLRLAVLVLACPITGQELLHSGHIDAWLLPVLALWHGFTQRGQDRRAALALIAAVLIKLTPLILLLPWFWFAPKKRPLVMITGAVGLLCLPPFALGLAPSLGLFYQSIEGYSPLFRLLRTGLSMPTARLVAGGLGVLLWMMARKDKLSPTAALGMMGGLALFLPFGFPWYLTAALPWVVSQKRFWPLGFAGNLHLLYYLDSSPVLSWVCTLAAAGFASQGIYGILFRKPRHPTPHPQRLG